MNLDKDIELVRLCQAGDISAFDELVRRHQERIYRLVYKILGGANECDDVSQEIFLRAYKSIKKFQCQSSFSTWLTQIAINQCINHLKRRKRIKYLSLGLVSIRQTLELQNITENNEKIEIVHKAINSLPLKQRVPIIMYYFESYNCEEIAEIMKCSTGTVKSRLFYARMELKEKLKPFLEDDGWIEVST
jgi:RNA polymerase sigma-70 factor (ECF subfamily)